MIEVVLVCESCGARSEALEGHAIDRYDYHDAPMEGLTVWEPAGWRVFDLNDRTLCPACSGIKLTPPLDVRGAGRK
jgi:hypothetical protein